MRLSTRGEERDQLGSVCDHDAIPRVRWLAEEAISTRFGGRPDEFDWLVEDDPLLGVRGEVPVKEAHVTGIAVVHFLAQNRPARRGGHRPRELAQIAQEEDRARAELCEARPDLRDSLLGRHLVAIEGKI